MIQQTNCSTRLTYKNHLLGFRILLGSNECFHGCLENLENMIGKNDHFCFLEKSRRKMFSKVDMETLRLTYKVRHL